jgi:exodeoxyribonuclease VII large subunit
MMPRGIGVVTSLGAAALHDVITTLQRRVPHIPVLVVPAAVQGANAPQELIKALSNLYVLAQASKEQAGGVVQKRKKKSERSGLLIDVILLVRGGGSVEDLWAFNDEQLARIMAQSPVPIVSGVGHETDFTIADFVADLRAPTPTAAAELAAQPRDVWQNSIDVLAVGLQQAAFRQIDQQSQKLDLISSRLGRPSVLVSRARWDLTSKAQRIQVFSNHLLKQKHDDLERLQGNLRDALRRGHGTKADWLQQAGLRLGLLDPTLVLRRGYAWLTGADGQTINSVRQTRTGQSVRATLADGAVDLTVSGSR